jgi:hypothetical protein
MIYLSVFDSGLLPKLLSSVLELLVLAGDVLAEIFSSLYSVLSFAMESALHSNTPMNIAKIPVTISKTMSPSALVNAETKYTVPNKRNMTPKIHAALLNTPNLFT